MSIACCIVDVEPPPSRMSVKAVLLRRTDHDVIDVGIAANFVIALVDTVKAIRDRGTCKHQRHPVSIIWRSVDGELTITNDENARSPGPALVRPSRFVDMRPKST